MANTTLVSTQKNWVASRTPQSRSLAGACLVHFLHDGYTDQLYALLPIWQAQFGLSYAGLALVRALYSATMGTLQVPADRLTVRHGARAALAAATFVSAAGYLIVAMPLGFAGLCIGLVVVHHRAFTTRDYPYRRPRREPRDPKVWKAGDKMRV